MRVAVHLHLYYMKQLSQICRLLQNLNVGGVSSALYVTMPDENPEAVRQIRTVCPSAQIWQTANRGYDIGPFIDFLRRINLNDCDYVLKLHTKSQNCGNYTFINSRRFNNALWGRVLWGALLETPQRFAENLQLLEQNPEIGMLGAAYCLASAPEITHAAQPKLQAEAVKLFGREIPQFSFIAGTMFLARAKLLQPFQKYEISSFPPTNGNIKEGTLAHIVERLLGASVVAQNQSIYGIKTPKFRKSFMLSAAARFLFQKKVTAKGNVLIKICKIPICCRRKKQCL